MNKVRITIDLLSEPSGHEVGTSYVLTHVSNTELDLRTVADDVQGTVDSLVAELFHQDGEDDYMPDIRPRFLDDIPGE